MGTERKRDIKEHCMEQIQSWIDDSHFKIERTPETFFDEISTSELAVMLTTFNPTEEPPYISVVGIDLIMHLSQKKDIPMFLPRIVEADFIQADQAFCQYLNCMPGYDTIMDCDEADNFKVKWLNTLCLIRHLDNNVLQDKYIDLFFHKGHFLMELASVDEYLNFLKQ